MKERKDLKRMSAAMMRVKSPLKNGDGDDKKPRKTVEPVKTSYIGGGHFEESDGFAGVGTKKTIRQN